MSFITLLMAVGGRYDVALNNWLKSVAYLECAKGGRHEV